MRAHLRPSVRALVEELIESDCSLLFVLEGAKNRLSGRRNNATPI